MKYLLHRDNKVTYLHDLLSHSYEQVTSHNTVVFFVPFEDCKINTELKTFENRMVNT